MQLKSILENEDQKVNKEVANKIGLSLLIPYNLFLKTLENTNDILKIQKIYNVPLTSIKVRAFDINQKLLIKRQQNKKLIKKYNKLIDTCLYSLSDSDNRCGFGFNSLMNNELNFRIKTKQRLNNAYFELNNAMIEKNYFKTISRNCFEIINSNEFDRLYQ